MIGYSIYVVRLEVKAHRLQHIYNIQDVYLALKQQGILVYSTCTYAMEENEQVIYEFIKKHPDMELIDCDVAFGRSGILYRNLDVLNFEEFFL